MTNNNLIFTSIVLCSLGGWYVVLTKYLELKAMMKNKINKNNAELHAKPLEPVSPDFHRVPEDFEFDGQHTPGMGPPPNANLPFNIPEDLLATMRSKLRATSQQPAPDSQPSPKPQLSDRSATSKRVICNWTSIIHLSGLTIVLGIPFLNIIAPALLWLFKKEQHPFLAKQGREVVNFQITLSLIQFLFLGLGALFVWLMPHTAGALFAATKTLRIIFSTGMHLPYNIFTVLPFYWGCIVIVRGAVSAYHGIAYKYPYSQPFIFDQTPVAAATTAPVKAKQEPLSVAPGLTNISFG